MAAKDDVSPETAFEDRPSRWAGVVAGWRGLSQWWRARSPRAKLVAYRLLTLAIIIFLWWAASTTSRLMPSPVETWNAAVAMMSNQTERATFFKALTDSLTVYGSALGIATVAGIAIGLLLGGFPTLGRTLEVYVNALMATPRIAFIPLILVFLGLFNSAKIFIVFLGAVMPIIVNTYAGVRNADGELVEMARSSGARRSQVFVKILLPGSLPFITVGLRLGATIGLINTVVAELYTALSGLGGLMRTYSNSFIMDKYFVVVLCFAVIGVAVTQGLRFLESRTDRWRYKGA